MRPNFPVNISEQFMIRECMRSFEGSVNMDLYEDVDDEYLRKEISCSKTRRLHQFSLRCFGTARYTMPKMKMLHNLSCFETRFRLLCR